MQDCSNYITLVQDCGNSRALFLELLQPCTKQSTQAISDYRHFMQYMHEKYKFAPPEAGLIIKPQLFQSTTNLSYIFY